MTTKPLNNGSLSKDEQLRLRYLDNREYQSKFLLDPDIDIKNIDYKHLDKNLAITNLKHNEKLGINEPEEARHILRGLHVLNNPEHFNIEEENILVGYKEETKEGILKQIPVYRKVNKMVSKFPKTFHYIRSEFISFTNTAAARGGFRMNSAISNKLIREDTITDKTKVNSRFGAIAKGGD